MIERFRLLLNRVFIIDLAPGLPHILVLLRSLWHSFLILL